MKGEGSEKEIGAEENKEVVENEVDEEEAEDNSAIEIYFQPKY